MTNLHDELHKCNESLIDAKSVIHASDVFLTEQFKKHVALVMHTKEKIEMIQKRIDDLIVKRDVHKHDDGAWPT